MYVCISFFYFSMAWVAQSPPSRNREKERSSRFDKRQRSWAGNDNGSFFGFGFGFVIFYLVGRNRLLSGRLAAQNWEAKRTNKQATFFFLFSLWLVRVLSINMMMVMMATATRPLFFLGGEGGRGVCFELWSPSFYVYRFIIRTGATLVSPLLMLLTIRKKARGKTASNGYSNTWKSHMYNNNNNNKLLAWAEEEVHLFSFVFLFFFFLETRHHRFWQPTWEHDLDDIWQRRVILARRSHRSLLFAFGRPL